MRFKATLAAIALSSTAALAADYSSLRGSQMAPTTGYAPSVAQASSEANGKASMSVHLRLQPCQEQWFELCCRPCAPGFPLLRPRSMKCRLIAGRRYAGGPNPVDELRPCLAAIILWRTRSCSASICRAVRSTTNQPPRTLLPRHGADDRNVESVSLNSTMKRTIDNYSPRGFRVVRRSAISCPISPAVQPSRAVPNITTLTYRHSGTDADPATAPVLAPFDTGFVTVSSANRNAYALGWSQRSAPTSCSAATCSAVWNCRIHASAARISMPKSPR